MKKIFLFFITGFLFFGTGYAQSKLGEVAVVYITTSNLDSSMALYDKLGFPVIASNDFPSPWAQVSDGSLLIMLRKDPNPYIGLTYYAGDVEKIVGELEKNGVVFVQKPKAGDAIRRYYFKDPDGFNIVLSNNLGGFTAPAGITLLTMNQSDYMNADKYPNKQCGAFGEYALPVKDINASVAFWKKLGFVVKSDMKQPYPHIILSDGLMLLGLHQTDHFTFPAVSYFGINTAKRVEQMKEKGVSGFKEVAGKNNVDLKTWEGQHIFIFSLGM
jgi:catechol 2,3-dioxygenase-like lactoylglutathione lyase family enzyme